MKRLYLIMIVSAIGVSLYADEHSYKAVPQQVTCTDTTRVLCIGNSFTFYYDCYNILFELAQSQGHYLRINSSYVGGYSFRRHLNDDNTIKAIESWHYPYDVVYLQNQSQLNAFVGRDPKRFKLSKLDAVELVARIRQFSPSAQIFLEATWSYPGKKCGGFNSMEEFDGYMTKGTSIMAKASRASVSPIGKAFAIVRSERPDVTLLSSDSKHQSMEGSYLKSCVNYLLVFGNPGKFVTTGSDCGLEPSTAAYLRSAAAQAVFGK